MFDSFVYTCICAYSTAYIFFWFIARQSIVFHIHFKVTLRHTRTIVRVVYIAGIVSMCVECWIL